MLRPIELNSLFDAVPIVLVFLGFAGIGLWMLLFPDDARRFIDNSVKKSDAYFNKKKSRATPRAMPLVLGLGFIGFALAVAAIVVISVLT